MKSDPPLGSSWRVRPAKKLVSSGGARRPLMGTLVAALIQKVPVVESKHCSTAPSLEGECGRLVPLFSSIVLKWRKRVENTK
jgi:hypothetical protein